MAGLRSPRRWSERDDRFSRLIDAGRSSAPITGQVRSGLKNRVASTQWLLTWLALADPFGLRRRMHNRARAHPHRQVGGIGGVSGKRRRPRHRHRAANHVDGHQIAADLYILFAAMPSGRHFRHRLGHCRLSHARLDGLRLGPYAGDCGSPFPTLPDHVIRRRRDRPADADRKNDWRDITHIDPLGVCGSGLVSQPIMPGIGENASSCLGREGRHYSQRDNSPSGKGSKNASGTTSIGNMPGRRGPSSAAGLTWVNRATGLPARVMTTSSPAAARPAT